MKINNQSEVKKNVRDEEDDLIKNETSKNKKVTADIVIIMYVPTA